MKLLQTLLAGLLAYTCAGSAFAQVGPTGEQIAVDPAVQKLDLISKRMAAYLDAMPSFEVKSEARWILDRENRQVGDSQCELRIRHPNSFHLKVGSEAVGDVWLESASDGKTVTRLYRTDDLAIFSKHEGGLAESLDDAMTYSSLKGSGIDLVLRPDFHSFLMTSVTKVDDHGEKVLDGKKTHHFSAKWHDGSEVEMWISVDGEPLLMQWQRRRKLDLDDGKPHEVKIDCKLTWKPNLELPEDFARISIPSGAKEVADIQHFLMKGGTDQLLGQQAPQVQLKLLDGNKWNLGEHRDKSFVVLYFFSSWAAPSTNDMPAVLRFIDEYEKRGVIFYAINVGEEAETVRAFMKKQNYTHPVVLDPNQQAAAAYRITSLPVTVLVGKDGSIQSVHVGTSPEERALIREDLKQLVEGKILVTVQEQE